MSQVSTTTTTRITQVLGPLKVVHNFLKEDAKLKARMMRGPAQRPEGKGAADIPAEFYCPISLEIMAGPVTLLQTGLNYDRNSMHEWLMTGGTVCPLTGLPLKSPVVLRPNLRLQAKIAKWAEAHGVPYEPRDFEKEKALQAVEKGNICQRVWSVLRELCSFITSRQPHPYPDIL